MEGVEEELPKFSVVCNEVRPSMRRSGYHFLFNRVVVSRGVISLREREFSSTNDVGKGYMGFPVV